MIQQTSHQYHHSYYDALKDEQSTYNYWPTAVDTTQYTGYQYSSDQCQVNSSADASFAPEVSSDETTSSSSASEDAAARHETESRAPCELAVENRPSNEVTKLFGLPDTCAKCGTQFTDDRLLVRHMKIDHYYMETLHFNETDPADRQKRYDEWFKKQMNRTSLPKELNGQYFKPYKCDICLRHYSYKGTLAGHRMKRHNLPTYIDGELIKPSAAPSDHYFGSFECDSCGFTAGSRKLFERHILRKHFDGLQPYPCDQCTESFDRSDRLLWHRRQKHAKQPLYTCSDCGRSYRTKLVYERHRRLQHTGHQFNCKECPKVFKSYASFDYHRRKHMGVDGMKFICEFCGFRFWSNQNRRKHIAKCHADNKVDTVALEENSKRDWSKEASVAVSRSRLSSVAAGMKNNSLEAKNEQINAQSAVTCVSYNSNCNSPSHATACHLQQQQQQQTQLSVNDFAVSHVNNSVTCVVDNVDHFTSTANDVTSSDHATHNNSLSCDEVSHSPETGETSPTLQMTLRYTRSCSVSSNEISLSPNSTSPPSSSSSSSSSSSPSSPPHYSTLHTLSPFSQGINGSVSFITHTESDIDHLAPPDTMIHAAVYDKSLLRCKMCFQFIYDMQDHLINQHKVAFEALHYFLELR